MVMKHMPATPKPVDIHVGNRLRQRRTLLGMTQEGLAKSLELSFQQIQKYERGMNRMGASRLYQFSQILDVPIAYFFDGAPKGGTARASGTEAGKILHNVHTKRETLELVRAFSRITSPGVRKRLLEVTKAMGKLSSSV